MIELDIQEVRRFVRYDPDTGAITRIVAAGNQKAGANACRMNASGYLECTVLARIVKAHRLAWALHHGGWPAMTIDHINGVKEDNRIVNLRAVPTKERGERDKTDNVLKNAPHTAQMLLAEEWHHDYPRQQAAYPVASLRDNKYWPPVGRVDNAWGDRNLVCACLPIEAYA